MSKELPYFRFIVSEWLNDDISFESYKNKGVFIDVCAFYWTRDCVVDLKTLKKRFSNAKASIQALIDCGIIKTQDGSDLISIEFLNNQYDMLSERRKQKQEAGRLGGMASGKQRSSNA